MRETIFDWEMKQYHEFKMTAIMGADATLCIQGAYVYHESYIQVYDANDRKKSYIIPLAQYKIITITDLTEEEYNLKEKGYREYYG